jgi:hypothetical protein
MTVALGVVMGIVINHHAMFVENIRVDLALRAEEASNSSAVAQRLLSDLPRGFTLEEAAASTSEEHKFVVPNIVHFIWFGENRRMNFVQYVSILSAYRIHRPDDLMFHCDHLPVGPYWEKLWHNVPIRIMHKNPPEKIHGQKLMHMYHKRFFWSTEAFIWITT